MSKMPSGASAGAIPAQSAISAQAEQSQPSTPAPPRPVKSCWTAQEMAEGRQFVLEHNFASPTDGSPPTYPLGGPQVWGSEATSLVLDDKLGGLALSPDGTTLAVGTTKGVLLLAVPTLEKVGFAQTLAPAQTVGFSPNGKALAAAYEMRKEERLGEWIQSVALLNLPLSSPSSGGDAAQEQGGYDCIVSDAVETITAGLQRSVGWSLDEAASLSSELSVLIDKVIRFAEQRRDIQTHRLVEGGLFGYWDSLFSPNNSQVLISGRRTREAKGVIRIVDVASREDVHELKGHTDSVMYASFSPDGSLIATSSWDGSVRIWMATTSECLHRLAPPVEEYHQLWDAAFSPDGSLIAVGSGNTHVYIWNVSTGVLVHKLGGFRRWIRSLAFAPDGRSLAAGGGSGTFRIFDVESGKCRQYWQSGDANEDHPSIYNCEVMNVQWSKDGGRVAFGQTDGRIVVYEEASNRIWEMEQGPPGPGRVLGYGSTILSPDGKVVFQSTQSSKTVRVWRLDD